MAVSINLTGISEFTKPIQLASPELFGGFPITALEYNWIIESSESGVVHVPVLLAATKYGTISALFHNDSDWKFVASPLSWEVPQHIQSLLVTPYGNNSPNPTPINRNVLIATLDQGEVAFLEDLNWNFAKISPSIQETRTRILLQEFNSRFRINHFSYYYSEFT